MKDKLAKLMGEKKKISPIEQKAKMNVLEQLKKDMQDMMGDKVAGLKKVTVASPDSEGLELGLEKAKNLIEGQESNESDESEESEGSEIESEEHQDHMKLALGESPEELSEESEEEIDSKIQELLKKKELLKK